MRYVIRRIMLLLPVLFGVSLLSFGVLRLIPGDPARVLAGEEATQAQVEQIRQQYGLDQPLATQYGLFLGRLANFINGELWGRPTDVPWAIVFPNGGPLPRHPSQLYEATLEGLVLLFVLWLLIRGGALKRPGFIIGAFERLPGGARPEIAYRTLFGVLAAVLVVAVAVYSRSKDIRPSDELKARAAA